MPKMRRNRRPPLRGSVQRSAPVRLRAREDGLGLAARLGIAGGMIVVATMLAVWGWRSGWIGQRAAELSEQSARLMQKAHFAVADIIVIGRQQTDKNQLFAAIEATHGMPIFTFKPSEAETRIARLSWVKAVTVERRLPDTIFVHLTERAPLARWQHDNHLAIIDSDGKILPEAGVESFAQLPLVVGAGAPAEAKELLNTLHSFSVVESKVTAAVRVGERRWDLHLSPNAVARLPEHEVADALKRLSILISEQKILERDIVAIDLRMPDRLVLEPGSSASHPVHEDQRL